MVIYYVKNSSEFLRISNFMASKDILGELVLKLSSNTASYKRIEVDMRLELN